MKKIILGIILATVILGGCTTSSNKLTTTEKLEQNIVTRTGTLSTKSGDAYLLMTSDGIVNITSTKFALDNYLKKKIMVTGMFSGDILYVDKLETN